MGAPWSSARIRATSSARDKRRELARIAGVNLPNQKRLEIGLTYIFGIGQPTARKVAAELGLNPDTKVKDLTDEEVTKLRNYIDSNLEVEGDLRRDRQQAIKRLSEIGAYRGIRHRRGLPVKGQRSGRETAIRSLQAAGLEILAVKDVTPQAHNGVRPRKRRRV